MTKDKTLGQRLGEAMLEEARKTGLPIYHRVIQFPNDDVPELLKKLREYEEASRKINIRIGSLYNIAS